MERRNSNAKPNMLPFTIQDFERMFPNDAACLEWLRNYLYPDGVYCIKCARVTKHHRMQSRPSYSCDSCGHHVHPTAGTIFHKSPTPLRLWFHAIYLLASTRCGISAKQVQREIGVTYKTAWRMCKQIRSMLEEDCGPLGGSGSPGVEMDETYYGGRIRGVSNKNKNKTCVVGVVERGGKISALATLDKSGSTLLGIAREKILPESVVFTDEATMYDGLKHMNRGYDHRRIHHSTKVYVVGTTHTNTIEGFWGLVKNGLRGVFHSVGHHYLQSYLNEYSFRYNRRHDTQPMFTSFLKQVEKHDAVRWQEPVEVVPF
jgi:transposase-like protein